MKDNRGGTRNPYKITIRWNIWKWLENKANDLMVENDQKE
jgi:hypothetical protein